MKKHRNRKRVGELKELVNANRKASREEELRQHGRPVSYRAVHQSKKVYNRKRMKADDLRHLPSERRGGQVAVA